ncbi:unnamed protein product, partial [Didymodactylos carnosus]
GPPVTFHVIGFGEVNDQFLNQIRTFGTRQGLFRYSTESKELQNNFNDMFEYALNVREFTIKLSNGKSYSVYSSERETIGFLTDDDTDLSSVTELTVTDDAGVTQNVCLTQMQNIRPLNSVRALNLVSPQDEEQLKMNQVPERVKLQLSALRHDAVFANAQRKKILDLRVNRNVDYFKKTDISGILQGYKASITPDTWQTIKEQKQDWTDIYSKDDIYEIMRKSPDNILCLGILVQRDEEAITDPTKGLKLLSVTNTIISYDSFINAMNVAKNHQQQQQQSPDQQQGQEKFATLNDVYCVAGALSNERINAVIPLYINDEHMKRIRILEGIWLGYLYTLDSYGYDKQQEVGLLKLLYQIIQQRTNSQRQKQILAELEKVCQFIIKESLGFKTAEQQGEKTYERLLNRTPVTQEYDLCIPLMIGYLKNDLNTVLLPIYYEYMRQEYQKKCKQKSFEAKQVVEKLIYGCEVKHETMTVSVQNQSNTEEMNKNDPDYIEKSFIAYYHDELTRPIELIPEKTATNENRRRLIREECELEYIKSLLLPTPDFIKTVLNYCGIDEYYIEKHLDYNHLRWELLITLHYLINFDTNSGGLQNLPSEEKILKVIDERLEGAKVRTVNYDCSSENVRLVSYVILNCKTLEGFGGLMRKYCLQRCGPIFTEVIKQLILLDDDDDDNNTVAVTKKDKLAALFRNQISTATVEKPLYEDEAMKGWRWNSEDESQIKRFKEFIDTRAITDIEYGNWDKSENLEKSAFYCYRPRASKDPKKHRFILF